MCQLGNRALRLSNTSIGPYWVMVVRMMKMSSSSASALSESAVARSRIEPATTGGYIGGINLPIALASMIE